MSSERYVMKNHRVSHEANEYILFNLKNKTRTSVVETPSKMKGACAEFKIEPISPTDAHNLGYLNFEILKDES